MAGEAFVGPGLRPAAELPLGVPAARAKADSAMQFDRTYKLRSETSELSRILQWTNFSCSASPRPREVLCGQLSHYDAEG
jgi:hypothetical protein